MKRGSMAQVAVGSAFVGAGRVAMDRTTARIVADVPGLPRPEATIVHRALFRKDRTC